MVIPQISPFSKRSGHRPVVRPGRLLGRAIGLLATSALLCIAPVVCRGGAVVVFNEIMYHPGSSQPAFEWLELHSQMGVNVDLSGWSIDGGIGYTFPEGTAISGGGYLVVALSPADLAAATGITNVTGPYTGHLSNAGDTLKLYSRDHHLMDQISYGVDGDWPVGADGSGVSLAKRNEDGASDVAVNWTVSSRVDGTPGRQNFPVQTVETTNSMPVTLTSPWRFNSATNLGIGWNSATYDDSSWSTGQALFQAGSVTLPPGNPQPLPTVFSSGVGADGLVQSPGSPDAHYQLTLSAQSTPPPPAIPATVIQNHPAWAANDSASSWIGPVNPGTTSVVDGPYNFRTTFNLDGFNPATAQLTMSVGADNHLDDVLLNGVSRGISFVGFSQLSGDIAITNGFGAGINTLDFLTVNDGPGYNPAGFRVRLSGTARSSLSTNTTLAATPTTYYFRTKFQLGAEPKDTAIQLGGYVADGAVIYLNGAEVLRLNLPGGAILPSSLAVSNITAPTFLGPFVLPNGSLVKGANVLAVEVHRAAASKGALFGSQLALTTTNFLVPPPVSLAFNEYSSPTSKDFWLEIVNYGTGNASLGGCVLSRHRSGATNEEYQFPAGDLAPGAFILLTKADLGFGADPGDRFFLCGPSSQNCLDAIVVRKSELARSPDGVGPWRSPAALTPGSSNQFAFHDEVIINELMYSPPAGSSNLTWVELYNRSGSPVNLTGWKLAHDIDCTFPSSTTIAAGGFLVVASDVSAMHSNYPNIAIVGPFSGKLGRGLLSLLDSAGNPVNEIRYYGDKPWPAYANGGGCSLELRDPWADNSKPEAWAASDESFHSSWTNVSYTMTSSQSLGPSQWNEFVIGLLDSGECLIEDLHVVQSPLSAPIEVLQNGTFNSGLAAWRALGDHAPSRVEADPAAPGNPTLHLIATGPTDHMHNHLETTLAGNRIISDGRQYRVSYRAKWLAGNNRLNTRLYFNRVAQTIALPIPALHGTPGARNTACATNIGPTFASFGHAPIVPRSDEPVTVGADIADPQGVAGATLYWSVNGGAWSVSTMYPSGPGTQPGYTHYSALVPAQPAGAIVQFYAWAVDGQGAVSTFPAAGPSSRALFRVKDSAATATQIHQFRLLMTPADASYLLQDTNVMSNAQLGLTVVYDDQEAFYDSGIHLQSSERGRDDASRAGFTIKLPPDHLFRGTVDNLTIDRSGGYSGRGGRQDELLLWHAVNHAGGIPGLYNDLVQCFAPRSQEDGTGMLRMSAFDAGWFDDQFKNGSDGRQFKLELIYYPLSTTDGNVQSPKVPQPDDVINFDMQDWGADKESYRWIFRQGNHAELDDYSQIVALNKAFSLSGAALNTQMNQLMDVDEYMRALAFKAFTGDGDTYTYGYNHNWKIYFRPDTGKAVGLLWDMDYSYCLSTDTPFPGSASPNTYKLVMLPTNYRIYYNHLLDLLGTVNAAYLAPWAAHYGRLVGQDWSGTVSYLQQRADFIRSKMPASAPFALTSNGGKGFATNSGTIALNGTASLNLKSILVNGTLYPIAWTTLTNWTLTIPLPTRVNVLAFQGIDNQGGALSNAVLAITVTNTAAALPKFVVINEWMADNSAPGGFMDLDDDLYSDWVELFNPNETPVNLSGCSMTDTLSEPAKWRIPTNTIIGSGGFLVVWADKQTNLNLLPTNHGLHANFKLAKSGSELGLFGPDGTPWHTLEFGTQIQNVSQGFFPDGYTNTLYFMTNWSPGCSNRLGQPPAPIAGSVTVSPSGDVSFQVSALPGRSIAVVYKNELEDPQWTPMVTNRYEGTPLSVHDALGKQPHRFYRVMLLP